MSVMDTFVDQIVLSEPELLAAVAEWERQTAVLALALHHAEVTGACTNAGEVSMKGWLRDHARMTGERAGELLALGKFLDTFPAFADAAIGGRLSGGQIDVARRLHRPKFKAALADVQDELVDLLSRLDITETAKAVHHWRACAEAVIDAEAPPLEPMRELTMGRTTDSVLCGRFTLDDAAATEFEKAIENAITWGGADEGRTLAERRGDALHDVSVFFNKNHEGEGTPRHLPHVTLSADVSTATTRRPEGINDDTQRPLSPGCTGMYLCDCKLHVILRTADGAPASFGRTQYTVPRVLFRQVAARDGGCRFPGCNRSVRLTDAHHIVHWLHGGETEYENLALLCSRHHHYVHELDLHLKLLPNGDLHVAWSDGRERISHPRGAPPRRTPT